MKRNSAYRLPGNPFFERNWEEDIGQVSVEPCDPKEDPLGYVAVFFVNERREQLSGWKKSFSIGASYLARRAHNLDRAGYTAPMTRRAIDLIEGKLGTSLPSMAV
jgi:hypothetical protein